MGDDALNGERAVKAVMGARSEYIFNNLKEPFLWLHILDLVCSCLYIGLASLESSGAVPVPIG